MSDVKKFESQLPCYNQMVTEKKCVTLLTTGEVHEKSRFLLDPIRDVCVRIIRVILAIFRVSLLTTAEKRELNSIKATCTFLDELEGETVYLDQKRADLARFKTLLLALKRFKKNLQFVDRKELNRDYQNFRRRLVALRYRLQEVNGGKEAKAQPEDPTYLFSLAEEWKKKHHCMLERPLTDRDKVDLREACRYPGFLRRLERDHLFRDTFFKKVLRDGLPVRLLVEYPGLAEKIDTHLLSMRVGRFASKVLDLAPHYNEKHVRLKFEGRWVAVENWHHVIKLSNNWTTTIEAIFREFKKKKFGSSRVEIFGEQGICNWDPHELGRWNHATKQLDRIDLTKDTWWHELPVFDRIAYSEIKDQYNIDIKQGNWVVVARSSVETHPQNIEGVHGFLEVLVPDPKNFYFYWRFPVGKFAKDFPTTTCQKSGFILNTVEARLSYPDENDCFASRKQVMSPVEITPDEGEKLMGGKIREDFVTSLGGNSVFQFTYENCAQWPDSCIRSVKPNLPNLYQMPVIKVQPSYGFLKTVINFIRLLPTWMQKGMLRLLEWFLGGHRSFEVMENGQKVKKSALKSPFASSQVIYHPPYLETQIREGKVPGIIHGPRGVFDVYTPDEKGPPKK